MDKLELTILEKRHSIRCGTVLFLQKNEEKYGGADKKLNFQWNVTKGDVRYDVNVHGTRALGEGEFMKNNQEKEKRLVDMVQPYPGRKETAGEELISMVQPLAGRKEIERKRLIPMIEEIQNVKESKKKELIPMIEKIVIDEPVLSKTSEQKEHNNMESYTQATLKKVIKTRKPIRINTTVSGVGEIIASEELEGGKSLFLYQKDKLIYVKGDESATVANFFIEIAEEQEVIHEQVDEENNVIAVTTETLWKLCLHVGMESYTGLVENEKLFTFSSYVNKMSRSRAILESGSLLRRCVGLQISAGKFETKIFYATPGWKCHQGRLLFVTDRGVVGHPEMQLSAQTKYRILSDDRITSQMDFWKFFKMRQIIPNKPENAIALQYFGLLGTLTKIYQQAGFPVKFAMAVVGKTNAKKTSCATIFTKLYNRKPGMNPDINFTSTEVAIYEAMEQCADSVLIVDDLVPAEDSGHMKAQMKKVEAIVRAYGDRVPRKRSKAYAKTAGIPEYSAINNCCLMTGEVWGGCKSSQSRVIRLNFEEGDVDNNKLLHYQLNLKNYTVVITDFLGYVTENMEAVMQIIQRKVLEARGRNPQEVGLCTPRLNEDLGIFEALGTIFWQYASRRGFVSVEQAGQILHEDMQAISYLLCKNDDNLQSLSPAVLLIRALREAVDRGATEIINLEMLESVENVVDSEGVLEDENFLYIRSEILWQIAHEYTKRRGIYFPYKTGKELIQLLKNDDLIVCKKEGNSTRSSFKLKIGQRQSNKRYIYIKKEQIQKMFHILQDD